MREGETQNHGAVDPNGAISGNQMRLQVGLFFGDLVEVLAQEDDAPEELFDHFGRRRLEILSVVLQLEDAADRDRLLLRLLVFLLLRLRFLDRDVLLRLLVV